MVVQTWDDGECFSYLLGPIHGVCHPTIRFAVGCDTDGDNTLSLTYYS